MALPYPSLAFTPFDILTAAELNEMMANISALQDGSSGLTIPSNSVNTSNLVNASVTADKIKDVQTATLSNTSWNNAKISGYSTTFRMGSASSGVAQTNVTVNLSSLSIPDNAVILQYHFWLNPAGNSGAIGTTPGVVYTITRSVGVHSIGVIGQWACNDATAPNLTNSGVSGFVRYIP